MKTRALTRSAPALARPASVCVVVNVYNDVRFLADALDSIMDQTRPADEVIVVEDGGREDPGEIVARYPGVRLIRQENQGLAGARNTGLAAAASEAIVFLDADDRLLRTAIADGLDALERAPDAVFAFGGWRYIREDGTVSSSNILAPAVFGYCDLLYTNRIGMHATVMYRRAAVVAAGGFDVSLRRCEDYDLYLRMARTHPVTTHAGLTAEYRQHGSNMSRDPMDMLHWALLVHERHREHAAADAALSSRWEEGRAFWTSYYHSLMPLTFVQRLKRKLKHVLPKGVTRLAMKAAGRKPSVGFVSLGDLSGVEPISDVFGYDRGTPVDRGYIEEFLQRNADHIRGRALEVGDAAYCRRFGGTAVTRQDVLHIDPKAREATIVGDLSIPGVLPKGVFDCLVLTQTLHLVWDMRAAVAEMHRSLKKGGVALVTVPGITRIDRGEWGRDWFWSLTEASARRLFAEVFGAENVDVEQFGNVYAATLFLQGLALEEADPAKLAVKDECFPVIIAIRAVKR